MKTLNIFVVELDKLINDTIDVGGKELFIDTRFEMGEFENRVNEAPVVCAPAKYDTGVKEGDTLYFHHHVVLQGGQKLFGDDYTDKNYVCMYNPDEDQCMANQAIAYKEKDSGEIKVLGHWIILEEHYDERKDRSDLIKEVHLEDQALFKGRLSFNSLASEELGIKLGEIVAFREGVGYPFDMDGKKYIRVPKNLVDYVQEEVHDA
jgi:co-chaperonin GroES (HSP10)